MLLPRPSSTVGEVAQAQYQQAVASVDTMGESFIRVAQERAKAIYRHGPLKAGPERWERLISEEYREVVDELATLADVRSKFQREATIIELAQLAQLCMGVIELIRQVRIEEE